MANGGSAMAEVSVFDTVTHQVIGGLTYHIPSSLGFNARPTGLTLMIAE